MKERRLTRALVVLIAASAVLVGVGGLGGAEVARADGCAPPRINLIYLPPAPYAYSQYKTCGIYRLETDAYEMYARTHGLSFDDPQLKEIGQYQMAGIMWQLLEQITLNVESGVPVTSNQQAAYQWLKDLVYDYRLGAAQKAIDEYDKWKNGPCVYVPPNTTEFTYRGSETLGCQSGSLASLLRGPTPPTVDEFIAYGMYDQRGTLGLDRSGSEQYGQLARQGVADGAAIWADLTVSAAPSLLYQLPGGVTTFQRFAELVGPSARKDFNLAVKKGVQASGKYARALINLLIRNRLKDGARILWGVSDDAAELAIKQAARVGIRVARLGLSRLTTVVGAAAFLVDVLESESEEIKRQQELLPKLQANLASVTPDLKPFLLDKIGKGNATAYLIFQAQLQLDNPKHGIEGQVVNAFPDDGTRIHVGYERESGGVAYEEYLPTVQIAAWPLGAGQGALGVPKYNVGISNGRVWHTPSPDEEDLGLTGYLPSGELRYFGWAGHPRIALVVGDKFLDLPAPGSIDMGNLDAGSLCDTVSACTLTSTLFALKHAKGVDPSYTTIFEGEGLTQIPIFHPSNGTLQPPFWKVRLTIAPDKGTPPGQAIYNQYGNDANTIRTGPPNGGLVAGETVQVTAPNSHPFGYDTTYIWHIETRCAYDPAHPAQVIEGVPTCYGDSDYGHTTLGQQDRDLLIGCPDACAPDPAFHGHAVKTVIGQSVPFTWPAPGTYHIRLITKDSFGATRQSDRNVVVVGDPLNVPLSATPGWAGPQVIGPVRNGSSFTIKGCIQNATMPYADPQVTVDWGDGLSQTYTGSGGGALTFGATASCSSPWSFSLAHAYNLTPPSGTLLLQKSVTLTITDGFGHSLTLNPYVNVIFNSPPQITSADATTFAAGTSGFFTFTASGGPIPSLAITSGSLPTGVVFFNKGDGTATLEGSANVVTGGGTYPLEITATNSEGIDTQNFTLTVNVAPSFTNDASHAMTAGQAGTVTFQTSGFPAPAISVDSVDGPGSGTALPSGLTFTDNGDGTATLDGTPDVASVGTYHLTMKATSAAGTAFQAFTLVVATAPAFTSADTVSWRTGASPTSFTITTSGSPAPDLDYSGSLPSGLGFADNNDGTGVIFGSTSDSGTFNITLSATNAAGTATQDLTINASTFGGPEVTFSGPNWVADDVVARFTEGTSGSVSIARSDGSGSLVLEGTPPSGLSFTDNGDGTATLSGTPDAGTTGYYGLKVTAASAGGDGFAFLSVAVYGPPSFTSDSTAHFTAGSAGSFEVTTAGAPRAALSETGALPDGLTFTDSGFGTATIAGTPTAAGESTIALNAENILGTADQNLTIDVDAAPAITSDSSAAFGESVTNSFDVTTSGFPVPALNVQGTLPPGIVFADDGDGTGTLSGTPTDTTIETYPFTIVATSTAGTTSQSFNLEVGPLPAFTSALAATFTTGKAGSFILTASGVPTPTLELVGVLPTGLSFSDNGDGTATIAGTPAAGQSGLSTVQVKAKNKYGSVTKGLALAVNQKPSFLGTKVGLTCQNATPPPFGATALFQTDGLGSWTLCTSGYPPGSLTLGGALPQGLSFVDNGDGTATISGTPAIGTGGAYPLTLKLSNAAGSAQQALTLNVVDVVVSTSEPDRPTFVAGQPNSYQLTAFGKPTPSFSFATPPPAWVTLTDHGDGTATLSGTPPLATVGSQFLFHVDEQNGVGNGFSSFVVLTVTDIGFKAASPPHATVGQPYSYSFLATNPAAAFSVADGADLPTGLTLSPSGVLSGTPTTVARWRFSVVATAGGSSARTPPIEFVVDPAPHQLQISKFRLVGPTGESDWFVELTNTTNVSMQLFGWSVRVALEGTDETFPIDLSFGTLGAHASFVVAGPFSSLSPLTIGLRGTPRIGEPGGFAVVAPDGTVTDKAGEVGVAADLREGTGVAVPQPADKVRQAAFVRLLSGGVPVDTNDNAHDFRYINLGRVTPTLSTTASAGVVLGGGGVSDTATLAGGAAPTGSVTFTLYGPNDADCSGAPVFTTTKSGVSGPGSYTSASFAPTSAGTYRWVASYSGDSDNGPVSAACNDPGESVVVAKARPTLTTKASVGVVLGGLVRDTASLAGGVRPTGKITFRLYGKSDTSCTNLPVFTTSRSVFDNGSYGSATFLPRRTATYRWIASYSGDQNNEPVTGHCNDPNESVNVSKARPVLTTKASPDVALGGRIRDTANLARGFSPTGKIVFRLYGPNDVDCSRAPVFTTARIVTGNGPYVSAAFTPSRKGTYRWVASYRGDTRNEPISHGCNAAYESVVVS